MRFKRYSHTDQDNAQSFKGWKSEEGIVWGKSNGTHFFCKKCWADIMNAPKIKKAMSLLDENIEVVSLLN